jgi:hypothetical protein
MDFELTPEQAALKETARAFAQGEMKAVAREVEPWASRCRKPGDPRR